MTLKTPKTPQDPAHPQWWRREAEKRRLTRSRTASHEGEARKRRFDHLIAYATAMVLVGLMVAVHYWLR
jgi:hypothetical protein